MAIENWLQLLNICAVAGVGLIGLWTSRRLGSISVSLDGRLSELLALTAKSSHAEGVEQQKAAEGQSTD